MTSWEKKQKRKQRTWKSKNDRFYLKTGGHVYSLMLQIGRLEITWERND